MVVPAAREPAGRIDGGMRPPIPFREMRLSHRHPPVVAAIVVVTVVAAGCAAGAPSPPGPSTAASPAAPAHWTYEGEEGPDRWGELSVDYAACASGSRQSPIDIAQPSPADLANVVFDYRPAPLAIVNNGHTVQVNYPEGSSISVDGASYDLLHFHFHAPSEHHVNPPVFDNLPPQAGPAATVTGVQVDPTGMLPQVRTTYRDPGSLTTP